MAAAQRDETVDVERLARDIFSRIWQPHSGHTSEHVAGVCFRAAMAFSTVARRIRNGATPAQAASEQQTDDNIHAA